MRGEHPPSQVGEHDVRVLSVVRHRMDNHQGTRVRDVAQATGLRHRVIENTLHRLVRQGRIQCYRNEGRGNARLFRPL